MVLPFTPLFNFAPDEVCRFGFAETAGSFASKTPNLFEKTDLAGNVATAEVGSYPAVSPLPGDIIFDYVVGRFVFCCAVC